MKHPSNRAERRHERERVINHRKEMRTNAHGYLYDLQHFGEPCWAQFSKWNGNCGSMRCHYLKYFGYKRKRREALKRFEVE